MSSQDGAPASARKRPYIIGGIAAVVVVALIVAAIEWWPRPMPTPVAVITAPTPAKLPAAQAQRPPPHAAAKAAAVPAPARAEKPSFDIVRVDPDGTAVIAGHAAPGADVTVLDGATVIGRATADSSGAWVLLPEKPLPPGRGELTLQARGQDGKTIPSDGVVAMMVPERPVPNHNAAAPMVKTVAAAEAAGPVAVLLPKEGLAKPLQLPPLKGKNPLSLDVIEYGAKGDVTIEGRSAPKATVEILLDNKRVGQATADGKGQWTITAGKEVPPGRYKLKIKARNGSGRPATTLVTPFERDVPPAQLAQDLVIVQPGNSLWRIARRSYGHGIRYVLIYHANQQQIHDPNLIFPGQLLTVPGKS